MLRITIRVDDAAAELALYGALARLHLQSASTEDGIYTDISFQTLVSGTDVYTFADDDGIASTWYRSYLTKADNTEPSDFSTPFPQSPALVVTPGQVRALVKTPLTNTELTEVIAREQGLLAIQVGPLTGSRVETITITDRTAGSPVRLRRPTSSVTVTEDNVATTDVRLGPDSRTVQRLLATGWAAGSWAGVVEVTYTPTDRALVETWLIELVRARLAESGHESETIEGYTYNRGERSHEATMSAAVADILGGSAKGSSRGLRSIRMSTDGTPRPWLGTGRP